MAKATRVRVRLPKRVEIWRPRWDPEIRGWSAKYIAKNIWRYEHINDMEDLMQDAYLVFLKVAEAYPRVVEAPHFMSLFKTSLMNMLFDKSREYERKLHLIDENTSLDDDVSTWAADPTVHTGALGALLASGPPELKMLITFMQDDSNLAALRTPQRAKRGEPRLNFDQRLARLLGIEKFPFRETLKQMLSA